MSEKGGVKLMVHFRLISLISLAWLVPSNGFIGGKVCSRTIHRPGSSLGKRFSNPTKGEVDIVQQQLDFALASETSSLVPVPMKQPARVPKMIDKPQLVTFDATGTIMRLAEPVGMHYREVLLKHTGLRLPRPSIFTMAFTEVYAARCDAMPCFGCGESVSSADWWVLAACAVTRPNKTFALCDRSQFLYTRASPGGRPSYATPT